MLKDLNFDSLVNPYPRTRNPIYAQNGMVATSQPLAANAGLEILKKGGNAVDAAVATAAALTVVEPTSNGIGGDAFAIVWMKGEMHGLNASGPAPKSISIEAVKAAGHNKMPTHGWTPVTVPGVPGAWASLIEKFGALSLSEVLAPAIKLAVGGFPVSPAVSYYWQRSYEIFDKSEHRAELDEWFATFAPDGYAPEPGELFFSVNHAKTLREIGQTEGKSFYEGELAKKMVAASSAAGGYLSFDDLASFKPEWVKPISVNYRGYDVWEIPPNGQGIVALMALNTLKGYSFKEKESVETYHLQFEAMKRAFLSGKHYITDLSKMGVAVDDLLSEEFASLQRNKIGDRASDVEPDLVPAKSGTVYLATADKDGNMVSYIQSNYMGFGSGVVVPGTGIAMQNRGHDFSLDESAANRLEGGKKSYHTIIPGFLTKAGQAVGPFGVMGGYMQPQGHVQVVMNTVDFHLNPQAVLSAPRWQWVEGKSFIIEKEFPTWIAKQLLARGHDVKVELESGAFGRGQIIWRDAESGVLIGGTEDRCDGFVAHY
ncbi:MAG: gamma-glutamyltransferase family protein [Turicibacter sp.]|nr:gamma-glutamyltransferase family protein [Turicibacter sp.]